MSCGSCQPMLPVDAALPDAVGSSVGGPIPIKAREGRQHQRYNAAGERLVAGCIPFRVRATAQPTIHDVQVLLVSSRGGKAWSFPKGGWETDETVDSAAKRETVEESGVRGALEGPLLGEFPFVSGKAVRQQRADEGRCRAFVFAMRVEEELVKWPEAGQRQRAWFALPEALKVLKSDWMRDAILAWVSRSGWDADALLPENMATNVDV